MPGFVEDSPSYRCRVCNEEFAEEQLDGLPCCPMCRTTQHPAKLSEDITVPMNWQDLRLMVAYARRWADENGDDESSELLSELSRQYACLRPKGSAPLSVIEEIRELTDKKVDNASDPTQEQSNVLACSLANHRQRSSN